MTAWVEGVGLGGGVTVKGVTGWRGDWVRGGCEGVTCDSRQCTAP